MSPGCWGSGSPQSGGGKGLVFREAASAAETLAERQACARALYDLQDQVRRAGISVTERSHLTRAILECKHRDTLTRTSGASVKRRASLPEARDGTDLFYHAAWDRGTVTQCHVFVWNELVSPPPPGGRHGAGKHHLREGGPARDRLGARGCSPPPQGRESSGL